MESDVCELESSGYYSLISIVYYWRLRRSLYRLGFMRMALCNVTGLVDDNFDTDFIVFSQSQSLLHSDYISIASLTSSRNSDGPPLHGNHPVRS